MFASATRLGRSFQAVMPYATWVICFVQLGYVGYDLYRMYQLYREQVERDSRAGRMRPFEETVELIITPRRRRNIQTTADNVASSDNATTTTTTTATTERVFSNSENQENQLEYEDRLHLTDGQATAEAAKTTISTTNQTTNTNQTTTIRDISDEPLVLYDSRPGASGTTGGVLQPSALAEDNFEECETLSHASTSLESTDSNKGIVNDIYSNCFVCTRSLSDAGKPVATLPFCMHPFHQTCLDSVLKWHSRCPVCNSSIFCPI